MAAVLYPQVDKPPRVSGGRDAWDNGPAGVVLSDDYFGAAAAGAVNLAPTTGSVDITGYAPTLSLFIAPQTGNVSVTGYAPSIAVALAPASGEIDVTGYAPSIAAALAPTTGDVDITGYAPSIDVATSVTLTPTTGQIAITGYAPGLVSTPAEPAVPVSLGGSRRRGFIVDDYIPQRVRVLEVSSGASYRLTGYAPTIRRTVRIADSVDIEIPDDVLAAALDFLDELDDLEFA